MRYTSTIVHCLCYWLIQFFIFKQKKNDFIFECISQLHQCLEERRTYAALQCYWQVWLPAQGWWLHQSLLWRPWLSKIEGHFTSLLLTFGYQHLLNNVVTNRIVTPAIQAVQADPNANPTVRAVVGVPQSTYLNPIKVLEVYSDKLLNIA
jgi:hypothetical protein